jgi:hypothetical protein
VQTAALHRILRRREAIFLPALVIGIPALARIVIIGGRVVEANVVVDDGTDRVGLLRRNRCAIDRLAAEQWFVRTGGVYAVCVHGTI